MAKISKVANCGITIIFCGIGGYFVNFIMPTSSSWAYLYLLGPIIIIVGVVISIIGAISGVSVKSTATEKNICSNCGAKLLAGYNNCPTCGEKVIKPIRTTRVEKVESEKREENICSHCGGKLLAGYNNCPYCGEKVI